ncbi:MAG: hypothetical protein PVH05_05410 [Burkholderiales bacterium]|jgi:hypothetical protein
MSEKSIAYLPVRIFGLSQALLLTGLILSGCSIYSVVPTADLKAEREKQQALEARQQVLASQVEELSEGRASLETQLAAETRKRKAAQALQVELDEALEAQHSAEQALNELERECEEWRELGRQARLRGSQSHEDDDARLYLLVLEKEAQIDSLTAQLETTILEVVRTKAKLRSLESKAEAASNLAEAEIAVETVKARGAQWKKDRSVVKAEELNRLSAAEFERGNYSGALYLTGEAKNVIKGAQVRSMNQDMSPMMEGEIAFAQPLSLQLLGEGDIRQGPGDQFKVQSVAAKGAMLVAYSYLGQWVHVKTRTGGTGWVYYKQLANPG